jgi:hypothetical protein
VYKRQLLDRRLDALNEGLAGKELPPLELLSEENYREQEG